MRSTVLSFLLVLTGCAGVTPKPTVNLPPSENWGRVGPMRSAEVPTTVRLQAHVANDTEQTWCPATITEWGDGSMSVSITDCGAKSYTEAQARGWCGRGFTTYSETHTYRIAGRHRITFSAVGRGGKTAYRYETTVIVGAMSSAEGSW